MTAVQGERRAVVLLSGGLDSATVLAEVVHQGYRAYALSVAYGQRHSAELAASEAIAAHFGAAAHHRAIVQSAYPGAVIAAIFHPFEPIDQPVCNAV